MQYLTKEAKTYCGHVVSQWSREQMVDVLEAICVACYDDEPESDFVAAIIDSIEAGDIEFDWGFAAAKEAGSMATRLWCDMDETWTDIKPEKEEEDAESC